MDPDLIWLTTYIFPVVISRSTLTYRALYYGKNRNTDFLYIYIYIYTHSFSKRLIFLSHSFAVSFTDIQNNIFLANPKIRMSLPKSILPVLRFKVLRTLPYLSYFSNLGAPFQLQYVDLFHLLVSGELQSL